MRLPGKSCRAGERARWGRGAFSLVEIIIVVGLLSVIMLGLMLMFSQTQRAFRTSMTQSDVLESGRAVTALLTRSFEEIIPSRFGSNTVNFYMTNYGSTALPPVLQTLPETVTPAVNASRTNVMEAVYFLTRENQQWVGTGFAMGTPAAGFGSLYRYTTNCPLRQDPQILFNQYQGAFYKLYTSQALPTNMTRVVDGVVHFKVRVFGTQGYAISNNIGSAGITNIVVDLNAPDLVALGGEVRTYTFTDAAVPIAIEYELGVMEDRALSRLRVIPDASFQRQQLSQLGVNTVHLFRQRVPIRNVDLSAYQ